MKLSTLFLIASAVSTDATLRSDAAKRALLEQSRVLYSEWDYLGNYSIKLISCLHGQEYTSPANGATESSSVVYRLCPVNSCSDSNPLGCKSGYGDYVVGLNTYVEEWLQDKQDSLAVDDNNNWKVEELGQCKEFKQDKNGNQQNGNGYWVGPTCTNENTVILGLFSDDTCSTPETSVTFEEISNGWSLPFSSTPLITTTCETCSGDNGQGTYEIFQMCENLYTDASEKCETGMAFYNQAYGQQTSGCDSIKTLVPAAQKSSNAGAAVGWTIFALVIVGAGVYAYYTWWMKKKSASGLAVDGM